MLCFIISSIILEIVFMLSDVILSNVMNEWRFAE